MADRGSARAFGEVFAGLAKLAHIPEARDLAMQLWAATFDYDFTHGQMDADDGLIRLGLAKRGIDPEFPQDGETIVYADKIGEFEA